MLPTIAAPTDEAERNTSRTEPEVSEKADISATGVEPDPVSVPFVGGITTGDLCLSLGIKEVENWMKRA